MRISVLPLSLLTASLYAQSELPDTPPAPNKKAVENTLKSPEAVKKQAKSLVKSTGSIDEKRALVKKRVAQLHAKQADFLKKVSEGKIQTFPNMRKQFPEIIRQIDSIKFAHQGIIDSKGKDLPEREKTKLREVEKGIFKVMQLIGPFLAHADTRKSDQSLTAGELKTLQAIEKEDRATGVKELPELTLVSEELAYTLHFIPAPIKVKATPNTAVYFEAIGGVKFKNEFKSHTNLKVRQLKEETI